MLRPIRLHTAVRTHRSSLFGQVSMNRWEHRDPAPFMQDTMHSNLFQDDVFNSIFTKEICFNSLSVVLQGLHTQDRGEQIAQLGRKQCRANVGCNVESTIVALGHANLHNEI
jgi:hypothetical protein